MELYWQEVLSYTRSQGVVLIDLAIGFAVILSLIVIVGVVVLALREGGRFFFHLYRSSRICQVIADNWRKLRRRAHSAMGPGLKLILELAVALILMVLLAVGAWPTLYLPFWVATGVETGYVRWPDMVYQPDAVLHVAAFFTPSALGTLVGATILWMGFVRERKTTEKWKPSRRRILGELALVVYIDFWWILPLGWTCLLCAGQD